jgi:hypothetical protein
MPAPAEVDRDSLHRERLVAAVEAVAVAVMLEVWSSQLQR